MRISAFVGCCFFKEKDKILSFVKAQTLLNIFDLFVRFVLRKKPPGVDHNGYDNQFNNLSLRVVLMDLSTQCDNKTD